MWQQRVRSVWMEAKKKVPSLSLADVDIPKNRSWRAFQLAFILINLPGLTSLDHPDRGVGPFAGADLLWFRLAAARRRPTLALRPMQWPSAGFKRTLAGATGRTA
jgi:hypothetical protein